MSLDGESASSPLHKSLPRAGSTNTHVSMTYPASPGATKESTSPAEDRSPNQSGGELHHRGSIALGSPKMLRKDSKGIKAQQQSYRLLSTSMSSEKKEYHAVIKYGSLLLLVGQMVGLVFLMRFSRTHTDGELYLASTAVFMMEVRGRLRSSHEMLSGFVLSFFFAAAMTSSVIRELTSILVFRAKNNQIMKFLLCLAVVFYQMGSSFEALASEVHHHVWGSPDEMLKLCVPSFLYTVQNNLLYLALTNLDAATYQILYQLKILSTAIFSATMLGRRFSTTKWLSLVVLTCGVAVVQVSGSTDHPATENEERNRLVGLAAVLCAACTSGFSGVYFEKILKGSEVTLWIRNIQMGIPSMVIAFVTVFVEDSEEVARKGFFVGYSPMVVTVITVQAVGGLIVAVVVKYADNVLKVFASSFSILLSCIISAVAFDFRPNLFFLMGAFLVVLSTAMYSKPSKKSGPVQRGQLLPIAHGSWKG